MGRADEDDRDNVGTVKSDSDELAERRRKAGSACLVVLLGLDLGKRFSLNRPQVIIGRSSKADIQIDQEAISRNHCKIINTGNAIMLRDMGSTNGTYVDGEQIDEYVLRDGDLVKVGRCIFKFLSGDNVESAYHEEMLRLTTVDALTSLFNRAYLRDKLEAADLGATGQLALVMFDLDLFKEINDTHGSMAGDHILSMVGERLKDLAAVGYTAARYSGDGFAILTDLDLAAAEVLAQSIATAMQSTPVSFDGAEIAVTISAGIAGATTRGEVATLLTRAEALVARAKLEGRNRVISSRVLRTTPSVPRRQLEIRAGEAIAGVGIVGRNVIGSGDRGAATVEDIEGLLGHTIEQRQSKALTFGRTQPGGPLLVVARGPQAKAELDALVAELPARFSAALVDRGLPHAPAIFGPIIIVDTNVNGSIATAIAGLMKHLAHGERSALPTSIAHAVRVMEVRTDPASVALALVALHETVLRWVLACAAAELAATPTAPVLAELRVALAKPSTTGTWMSILRKALQALASINPVHNVWAEIADTKRCAALSDFVKHRNDFVHGGSADERIARTISDEWRPKIEQLIEGPLRGLLALAPIEITEVDFSETDLFSYTARHLQGDDVVPRSAQVSSRNRMRRGSLYLHDGRLDRTLLLEPFAIAELCPSCSARELFLLDRVSSSLDKVGFVNPTTGHAISELSESRRRLLERLP